MRRPPILAPQLYGTFDRISDALANGPRGTVSLIASLIKVFLPYFTNDVVFDNTRVVEELGEAPAPFTDYCVDLYAWAKSVRFEYPYAPLPSKAAGASRGGRGMSLAMQLTRPSGQGRARHGQGQRRPRPAGAARR